MPADAEDTLLPFNLPSIGKKKITAAFDGGQISSDGGVLLLAGADKRLGLIDRLVEQKVNAVSLRWDLNHADVLRDYAETSYAAGSWTAARRVVARIEATCKGVDTRYVVTNITERGRKWLYETLYCARGQAENLIKRHKGQLASDRTSCRSPLANQMRLVLHTAAYWLMRSVQDDIPVDQPLATGDYCTIRLRLLKIAVRVRETATRVRLAFAANCPDAALFRALVTTALIPKPG